MQGPLGNNGAMTSDHPSRLLIGTDAIRIEIEPSAGGRISQVTCNGVELLIGRGAGTDDPVRWGCYPMVPWAGRVRHGRFELDGITHQLPVGPDGHAMHGVGFTSAWTVTGRTDVAVEMSLQLPTDETWPFGGHSWQRIAVDATTISLELSVTAGDRRFPATIGWHPWFRKPTGIEFHPVTMYRRVDGIAVDEQIAVPPGPWDDCFVNTRPVVAVVDGIVVELRSDCTDWVVYDETPHATCIEAQSGPPDAFNIRSEVLDSGHTLSRWYTMSLPG
jgi:aldose 1-epimerase